MSQICLCCSWKNIFLADSLLFRVVDYRTYGSHWLQARDQSRHFWQFHIFVVVTKLCRIFIYIFLELKTADCCFLLEILLYLWWWVSVSMVWQTFLKHIWLFWFGKLKKIKQHKEIKFNLPLDLITKHQTTWFIINTSQNRTPLSIPVFTNNFVHTKFDIRQEHVSEVFRLSRRNKYSEAISIHPHKTQSREDNLHSIQSSSVRG